MFDFIGGFIQKIGIVIGSVFISIGGSLGATPVVEEPIQPEVVVEQTQNQENNTATSSEDFTVTTDKKPTENTPSEVRTAPTIKSESATQTITPATVTIPVPKINTPKDFRAKCELTKNGTVDLGEKLRAEIDIIFENASDYDFVWDDKFSYKTDHNEAYFELNKSGDYTLSAKVTRKSDGYSKTVSCPALEVVTLEEEAPDTDTSDCDNLSDSITILENEYYDYISESNKLIHEASTQAGLTKSQAQLQAQAIQSSRKPYEDELNAEINKQTSLFYRECK